MGKYFLGKINGIEEGDHYPDRATLRAAGIHLAMVAGIDGNPREGASSIFLNGGYVEDLDLVEEIIYTGLGGNDLSSKRQKGDDKKKRRKINS